MRFTMLCLTIASIGVATQPGCMPAVTPEPIPTQRGTIATQASASADTAGVGESVELTAQASGAVAHTWAQVAGHGVQLTGSRSATAGFEAPSLAEQQTLRFRVMTRNDAGDVGSAAVEVNVTADPDFGRVGGSEEDVENTPPPVARAGSDRVVAPESTVTLDGTGSTGLSLRYRWRQTAGTPSAKLTGADTAIATFVAPKLSSTTIDPGSSSSSILEFELQVTDVFGRIAFATVVITVGQAGPDDDASDVPPPDASNVRVLIVTDFGPFTVELDSENAPNTVANFLQYVDEGFYDGTIFHRVIPGFVVQGGGFLPGMVEKTTRDPIKNESDNGVKNLRGTLAMARTTDPDSATAQFFVNLVDNPSLDPVTGADGYAVFGRVVAGMGVIDTIATVETTSRDGFNAVPVDDIRISSAERVEDLPTFAPGSDAPN